VDKDNSFSGMDAPPTCTDAASCDTAGYAGATCADFSKIDPILGAFLGMRCEIDCTP